MTPQQPRREEQSDRSDHVGRNDANAAWAITGTLLSGIVVWGGVGFLLGRWLGAPFLGLIGILVGVFAALYLVYVKYGKPQP